jgi:hypothetical protein
MTKHSLNMDAYAPAEMARRVETVGVAKANLDAPTMFALAVLAAAFIALGAVERLAQLTWAGFFLDNLFPVTLGKMVGGAVMVAAVYWFVYLRGKPGNRVVCTWRHLTHAPTKAGSITNDQGGSHLKSVNGPTTAGVVTVLTRRRAYGRGGIEPWTSVTSLRPAHIRTCRGTCTCGEGGQASV